MAGKGGDGKKGVAIAAPFFLFPLLSIILNVILNEAERSEGSGSRCSPTIEKNPLRQSG